MDRGYVRRTVRVCIVQMIMNDDGNDTHCVLGGAMETISSDEIRLQYLL